MKEMLNKLLNANNHRDDKKEEDLRDVRDEMIYDWSVPVIC